MRHSDLEELTNFTKGIFVQSWHYVNTPYNISPITAVDILDFISQSRGRYYQGQSRSIDHTDSVSQFLKGTIHKPRGQKFKVF